MARVYRAYHPQLDRYVAIKVLRSDLVEEEEFLARFRREAQAVAALRHPNVVQVYDFDVQDEIYYMVMELLEGDTLKVRLNDYRVRDERMPWGEVIRIQLDVLDGLAYAHSEEMVHRDIKPANILLTRRGQVVVADFGIAQMVGGTQHTASGMIMGTLNYIAPEQGLQGRCDARSDIYSLGIVFYEMLTQRTPFEADTPLAVLMKHLNDPLPLPRRIDPTIPEPFERIVLRALAKEPDDRYQNAQETAQALRQSAEEIGILLPERVSLPFSFTTDEAPSESVAVLSGTARDKVEDARFADENTDPSLAQRLADERAVRKAALPAEGQEEKGGAVGQELLSAANALGVLLASKVANALQGVAEAVEGGQGGASSSQPGPASPGEMAETRLAAERMGAGNEIGVEAEHTMPAPVPATGRERSAAQKRAKQARRRQARAARRAARPVDRARVRSILGTIGLVIALAAGINLMAVWIAGLTGWWSVYTMGWPMELFLIALGFCAVMATTASIWMLIPAGILLGNGLLFTYYSLTGNWDHWLFLWPLEPLLIVGSVFLTIWLAGLGQTSLRLARVLGWVLGLMAAAWSLIVPLAALVVPR
jgi:tRNA A-37 threonylcarbamoyl transferase component Bud32